MRSLFTAGKPASTNRKHRAAPLFAIGSKGFGTGSCPSHRSTYNSSRAPKRGWRPLATPPLVPSGGLSHTTTSREGPSGSVVSRNDGSPVRIAPAAVRGGGLQRVDNHVHVGVRGKPGGPRARGGRKGGPTGVLSNEQPRWRTPPTSSRELRPRTARGFHLHHGS